MMTEAIEVTKARGEWVGAIPENSPVREPRSNGRAERAVQQVEDHLRTHLAELEERLGQPLKSDNPILAWLVEYIAVLLNKYHPHEATGETAYQSLHGKEAEERLAYFAEQVYFHVHSRRRSNLDLRWGTGIFLGTLMASTECPDGLSNGDVLRSQCHSPLHPKSKAD